MSPKKTGFEIKNFELAFETLKGIVGQLENGKLTLSESLERYEEGIKSLKECYSALNQAQLKIEQLVKLDENGKLITKPFDDAASFDSTKLGQSGTAETGYGSATLSVNAGGKNRKKSLRSPAPKIPDIKELDSDAQTSGKRTSRASHMDAALNDELDDFDELGEDQNDFDDQNSLF